MTRYTLSKDIEENDSSVFRLLKQMLTNKMIS